MEWLCAYGPLRKPSWAHGLAPGAQDGNNGIFGEKTKTMNDGATDIEPGLEVMSCFPTPMVVAQVPSSNMDNTELQDTILDCETSATGVRPQHGQGTQNSIAFNFSIPMTRGLMSGNPITKEELS